ncbi:hypothetical protein LSTR_LSTR010112 [Laodelphax striatellus]|uniref:ZZ-type domain-containing protein n=1 Tax=Laodelphax striatellus TaxID=195883 RepID=A0A482X435_LAOST|nr:hypothetical protein LSTR_LSTR010112 [Laodelphax striatellus]
MASTETITCTYCENEIVGLRVRCCECIDFEMCLQFLSDLLILNLNQDSLPTWRTNLTSTFGGVHQLKIIMLKLSTLVQWSWLGPPRTFRHLIF